jgi:hypothetical protein
MTRDHFNKMMHSPYFQSAHYRDETVGGQMEQKFERILEKMLKKINPFKKNKD